MSLFIVQAISISPSLHWTFRLWMPGWVRKLPIINLDMFFILLMKSRYVWQVWLISICTDNKIFVVTDNKIFVGPLPDGAVRQQARCTLVPRPGLLWKIEMFAGGGCLLDQCLICVYKKNKNKLNSYCRKSRCIIKCNLLYQMFFSWSALLLYIQIKNIKWWILNTDLFIIFNGKDVFVKCNFFC